jgi:hypothetical protein
MSKQHQINIVQRSAVSEQEIAYIRHIQPSELQNPLCKLIIGDQQLPNEELLKV